MEKMILTVEWEGLGPYGPKEIEDLLCTHYKKRLRVRRLHIEEGKPEKLVYSVPEAASLLGISKAKLYSLVYQKEIPAVQYGKRWLIPKAQLEKQFGESVPKKETEYINEAEKADLLATADEALKLYDILRNKINKLVKDLSK